MPYAPEFTKELGASYLASLLNPIEEREAADIGGAYKKYQAGGLGAQAATGAEVGAIEAGAARNRSDVIGRFNWDVANKTREERLTAEERLFKDEEREKTEHWQERLQKDLAEMGYGFQKSQSDRARQDEKDGAWQGALMQAGTMGFGEAAGSWGASMGGGGGGGVPEGSAVMSAAQRAMLFAA